jgi:radical SAM superfamily enzyme YgiQ (UPF0313 family)
LTVPLGIGYLKAYASEYHGDSVDIQLFKHPDRLLEAIHQKSPDIVGLANYGWNESLNLTLGTYIRSQLPKILIVAGGPNIDPAQKKRQDFLNRHHYLDFVFIDGGEESFSELITWWQEGSKNYSDLPQNMVWNDGGLIQETPERPLKKLIQNIPSPYLAGYLDEFLKAGLVPMFETNRGCPFQCTFCAWGMASKNMIRRFDVKTAIHEVEYVGARSKASNWIFCDANFGILERDIDIAKTIRKVKDQYGHPQQCQIWLAKNVTQRNLEVAKILDEMCVPVMAVQSLEKEVLKNIKRGNISTETYVEYQQKFHSLGRRTYSDLIVPLPGETLETHIQSIRSLFDFGVDIIACHNMRLLAGAETNSDETRKKYDFKTRFRVIHGDVGIYSSPDGSFLKTFEFEESLRETITMNETDLFYLRKLHFLIDFCWNSEVYKIMLQRLKFYGINPIDLLEKLVSQHAITDAQGQKFIPELQEFWNKFDQMSHDEWFDSEEDIISYFSDQYNFNRLANQKFDKLNIYYGLILLRDYKPIFDEAILHFAKSFENVPVSIVEAAASIAFATFPAVSQESLDVVVETPQNFFDLNEQNASEFQLSSKTKTIFFQENEKRTKVLDALKQSEKGYSLSKIFNTEGLSFQHLRFIIPEEDK